MAIPNATHKAASDAIAALGDYISVHTGAAGTTGTNEATGGGYARQQTVWTSGATGINTGDEVTIPVAAGTYVEAGIYSAVSGGTFVGSAEFDDGDVEVSGSGASIDVTPRIVA
ncbi:minor tail protein [Mycobacterium phage Gaia]|uniref:Minor tail protein n=1 Tax=Mycobacterium phage Gaia TaxID=1486472 RepID=A0A068F2D4_9CAUD|nr:head protein [Mycobacterium phage Gaia]AID58844.1 minor tail protein [Mycobacterium phage Gaia]